MLGAIAKLRMRLALVMLHAASCLQFGYYKQNIGTWHVTTRTTPSQPHVFICPECVNDSLVLGIVVKQIAQRKEGMFP